MDKTRSGDLDAENGNFRGFTAKRQGHIHNYVKNPRVYLLKVQGGWNLGNLIVSGGFLQKELDT
jgi:hypothetical protein